MKRPGYVYASRSYWPYAAWNAYCLVSWQYERPLRLNELLQDYAVNNGIVFG